RRSLFDHVPQRLPEAFAPGRGGAPDLPGRRRGEPRADVVPHPAVQPVSVLRGRAPGSIPEIVRARRRFSRYTFSSVDAAGVTPGSLAACARVRGRTRESVSRTSRDSPATVE